MAKRRQKEQYDHTHPKVGELFGLFLPQTAFIQLEATRRISLTFLWAPRSPWSSRKRLAPCFIRIPLSTSTSSTGREGQRAPHIWHRESRPSCAKLTHWLTDRAMIRSQVLECGVAYEYSVALDEIPSRCHGLKSSSVFLLAGKVGID